MQTQEMASNGKECLHFLQGFRIYKLHAGPKHFWQRKILLHAKLVLEEFQVFFKCDSLSVAFTLRKNQTQLPCNAPLPRL